MKRFKFIAFSPLVGIISLPFVHFASCWDTKGCNSVYLSVLAITGAAAVILYVVGSIQDYADYRNNKTSIPNDGIEKRQKGTNISTLIFLIIALILWHFIGPGLVMVGALLLLASFKDSNLFASLDFSSLGPNALEHIHQALDYTGSIILIALIVYTYYRKK